MKDIKILVITHKEFDYSNLTSIFFPLEVGAENREKNFLHLRDNNFDDNISTKNDCYCELTGLYSAYKNMNYNILGLCHYRRFFLNSSFSIKKLITQEKINKLLTKYDVILPKKRHYYIETNYSHYIHAHKQEALDLTIEIIKEKYPNYYVNLQKHLNKRSGHYFNMFIAQKEIINPCLKWLFNILFELETKIDIDNYNGEDRRVFGFVSELLFDVYFESNKLKIKNQKYRFVGKQKWFLKIKHFLERKLKNKIT